MSIGIDFGIGIDENSWYRPGIVSKPKKLVSPIPSLYRVIQTRFFSWLSPISAHIFERLFCKYN